MDQIIDTTWFSLGNNFNSLSHCCSDDIISFFFCLWISSFATFQLISKRQLNMVEWSTLDGAINFEAS